MAFVCKLPKEGMILIFLITTLLHRGTSVCGRKIVTSPDDITFVTKTFEDDKTFVNSFHLGDDIIASMADVD